MIGDEHMQFTYVYETISSDYIILFSSDFEKYVILDPENQVYVRIHIKIWNICKFEVTQSIYIDNLL